MTRDRAHPGLARIVHGYHLTGLQPDIHIGTPGTTLVWVIDLDGSYRLDAQGTDGAQQFASSVSGLSTRPAAIHHGTVQSGVYIELSPVFSQAVFGVPAAELAGATVELAQLWGPAADRVLDRLHTAPPDQREPLLRGLIRDCVARSRDVGDAADLWRLATERGLTPAQLALESGWSTRHLRRLLLAQAGMSPGTITRLARFERSLTDVRRKGASLAAAAARNGYADQAHLSRDWRTLLGMSPTEFLRRQGSGQST